MFALNNGTAHHQQIFSDIVTLILRICFRQHSQYEFLLFFHSTVNAIELNVVHVTGMNRKHFFSIRPEDISKKKMTYLITEAAPFYFSNDNFMLHDIANLVLSRNT